VPYSVASRQLAAAGLGAGEQWASTGRTIYPAGADPHRRDLIRARAARTFAQRVIDTRLAGVLPCGRVAHLAERFPPSRGIPGSGVGLLYHGEGRVDALAMAYLTAAHEAPGLVPSPGELAWAGELGEETAVDITCADLDRAARDLFDAPYPQLCARIHRALVAGERSEDWSVRLEAARLLRAYEYLTGSFDEELPHDGPRQILDALLVVADDGHAPGTRVRVRAGAHAGIKGTILRLRWGLAGPPVGYDVRLDARRRVVGVAGEELVVLPGQETITPSRGDSVHIG
jgi:hypothetical protein